MSPYTEFVQFCRICRLEMLVASAGAIGLPNGLQRDAVCSEVCRNEFMKRESRSMMGREQNLDKQREFEK